MYMYYATLCLKYLQTDILNIYKIPKHVEENFNIYNLNYNKKNGK